MLVPGLGFETCSAASFQLPDGPSVVQHVDNQIGGSWSFFNFTVGDADYAVATVTATAATSSGFLRVQTSVGCVDESFGCMHAGDVEMYLKFWQTPGRDSKQYDRRSNPGDFRHPGSHRADLSSSVSLDKSCDCEYMLYRPGTWFLGVFVSGHEPASFDVRLAKSRCPNDCGGSGRGTCDAESGACTCAKVSNNEQLTA